MSTQRVLVMNGQWLLQTAGENGRWKMEKAELAAGNLKPGIYNLASAKAAADDSLHVGVVIHADRAHVYQQTAKGQCVRHEAGVFAKAPAIGSYLAVRYVDGAATVSTVMSRARGRHR